MLVVRATYFRFGTPDGIFGAEELKHGIHGGAVETSMMLALCPDLVRQDQAANFRPLSLDMEADYEILRPEGPAGFAWASQDLHPSGAAGDAGLADPEKGGQLLAHAAERLVAVLRDLRRAPLSLLRDRD